MVPLSTSPGLAAFAIRAAAGSAFLKGVELEAEVK